LELAVFFFLQNVYAIIVNIKNFNIFLKQKYLRKIQISDLNTFSNEYCMFSVTLFYTRSELPMLEKLRPSEFDQFLLSKKMAQ
jgi:hypothetical protein